MNSYHLAQINIAKGIASLDDPLMRDFVDQIDFINGLADQAPGFVWRLQSDLGNATDIQKFPDEKVIVNMSVWESLESLKTFVYSEEHLRILRQKKKWFENMTTPNLALWWLPVGSLPTLEDGREALATLESASKEKQAIHAFTFSRPVPPPQV